MKKQWRIRVFDGSGGFEGYYTSDSQPDVVREPNGRLVLTAKDGDGIITIYVSANHTVGFVTLIEK